MRPSEIRELIAKLRFDHRRDRGERSCTICIHEWLLEDGRCSGLKSADAIEHLLQYVEWRPIEEAPKDGTKVDLLYPEPRGRTNDCYWGSDSELCGTGWIWRTPTWEPGSLEALPEEEWSISCYPNMDPTHFRIPPPPETEVGSEAERP